MDFSKEVRIIELENYVQYWLVSPKRHAFYFIFITIILTGYSTYLFLPSAVFSLFFIFNRKVRSIDCILRKYSVCFSIFGLKYYERTYPFKPTRLKITEVINGTEVQGYQLSFIDNSHTEVFLLKNVQREECVKLTKLLKKHFNFSIDSIL